MGGITWGPESISRREGEPQAANDKNLVTARKKTEKLPRRKTRCEGDRDRREISGRREVPEGIS